MKRNILIALTVLVLVWPGLSCAEGIIPENEMEDTIQETGMVPFLCFDWTDVCQDADACREKQPMHHVLVTPQGQHIGYRLVLEKLDPELVSGVITVDGGLPQVLELVWSHLTQSMLKEGLTAEGQSFTGGYCRISFLFTGEETITQLQVMNEPSGSCIRFRCQPNITENEPLSGGDEHGSI